eukprot:5652168-Amphidinium_carterae.1
MVLSVRGTPWRPRPTTALEAEGEEVRIRVAADPVIARDGIPEAVRPRVLAGPRAVYLRKRKELAKHGFTPGCPGCDAA